MFTSDLSVNEFLLIKEVGFHPLGFVMGSSIYHLGIQTRRWSQSQELAKLTEAMYNARELAMNRMDAEAVELGADGVVGVRLDVNYYEWGSDTAEFIALGTAVKSEDGRSYRNNQGKPFTSDLSGQDFWTLMQTGHVPLGLVMGTCVYHIAHRGLAQTLRTAGQNVELPNFTQALYEARELAMTRMQDEANELGATGHRRRPAGGEEPHVGRPHHRVPLPRHGRGQDRRRAHHPRAPGHHLARRMTRPATPGPNHDGPDDLPEAAARRLRAGRGPRGSRWPTSPRASRWAWSRWGSCRATPSCSGAGTSSTYYRTMTMGGLGRVAGPSGRGQYSEGWQCPHGFVGGEHRMYGYNFEQTWVEGNWASGWGLAFGGWSRRRRRPGPTG